MSRTIPPSSYTPIGRLLRLPRPDKLDGTTPRRVPRGRVLVVRGYSSRWPRLSRFAWWLRLLPVRLAPG